MKLLNYAIMSRADIRSAAEHLVQGASVAVADEEANYIEELRNYHRILDSVDELLSAMIKRIK